MAQIGARFLQLKEFLARHKKTAILAFIICIIVLAPTSFAHAQLAGNEAAVQGIIYILIYVLYGIGWLLGKLIVITISMLIIPILGYNNFGDSNIISIGWPLVRDIVNMFVIVILLFVAVKTMLGLGKDSMGWQQQLPGLFLAMVAVNFSRTLTVLMIDAGQVVMMTFVNALRNIAAGNFVDMFQLGSFFSISITDAMTGQSDTNALIGYLGSQYAIVALLSMVLAVLFIMAVVFIYRIVVLWVLVIISPLAFFMYGIKGMLGSMASNYAEWWKTFVGAVTLGPILTFFLWLGLAAASQGSIAAQEQFDTTTATDTYGLMNEIFQVDKLLSLLIGLLIIVVGFKAASSAAGGLGGVAATYINEGMGMKMAKGALTMPGILAGKGAAKVGIAGAKAFERRTGVGQALGGELATAGTQLEKALGGGVIGGLVGGGVRKVGGKVAGYGEQIETQDRKIAQEALSSMSSTEYAARAEMLDKPGDIKKKTLAEQQIYRAMQGDVATNKEKQKELKQSMTAKYGKVNGEKKADDIINASVDNILREPEAFIAGDPARREKVESLQKKRLDRVQATAKTPADAKIALSKLVDENYKPSDLNEAAITPAFRDHAKTVKVGQHFDKNGNKIDEFLWDRVLEGRGGTDPKVKAAAEALDAGPASFQNPNPESIRKAVSGGRLNLASLTAADVAANPENISQALAGLAAEGQDVSTVPAGPAIRDALAAHMRTTRATRTPEQARKTDAATYVLSGNIQDLGVDVTTGAITGGYEKSVEEAIKVNPKVIIEITPAITAASTSGVQNAAQQAAARAVSPDVMDSLVGRFDKEVNATVRTNLHDAMDSLQKALQIEAKAPTNSAGERKKFGTLERQAAANVRYMV